MRSQVCIYPQGLSLADGNCLLRHQSLFRGGGGLVQIGGGSMIFMQGKMGGHINLCMHVRELCYTKGVRE